MIFERLNSSYVNHLLAKESDLLHDDLYDVSLSKSSQTSLSFDDRIDVFKLLSKSILFQRSSVFTDDIEFWFPECSQSFKQDIKHVISKTQIDSSLECVIAELMER
ncbi:hypothetical protein CL658_02025 [bacterium]|nr:hypothetical protein [bacterium]|tara:strand:- start:1122 stop:1439 length:318 start_codon:yes stop_codon:yes gene_type:complete